MTRMMILAASLALGSDPAIAGTGPGWQLDAGVRLFKHSATGDPNELAGTAVFERWEALAQDSVSYAVGDYAPLDPLYFNMNFGADLLFHFRRNLMVKVGYDHSNPLGIGGSGHISYTDRATGSEVSEEKRFSYISHQLNYFVGPVVAVGEDERADIYLGFSMMSPTWVVYRERYQRTVDGQVTDDVDRVWRGFFGSCRAAVGIQVRAAGRVKIGSELVYAFLNYMPLESGALTDHSFAFPSMMFDVTFRYAIR